MRHASLQSAPSARVWLKRSFLLLLAAGSLLVVTLNARALLAEAYATYARESLSRGDGEAALASAGLAQRLQPRNADYAGLLARAERRHGSKQKSEELYLSALRQAPADAALWRDYALLQVTRQQFDGSMEHAVARAQALNPANRRLHLALGITGLSTWPAATPAVRRLWQRSIDFQLEHDRKEFLRYVFASGREAVLCRNFKGDAALRDWCYWTQDARRTCYRAELTPKQQRACKRLGAYIGRTP